MGTAPEHRTNRAGRTRFGASVGLTLVLSLAGLAVSAAGVRAGQAAPAPAPQRNADPVAELLAVSTLHFERGQRELREGHLEMARSEFNRSLEVLLESRYGGRTEPRIREHFDRLVERISAYELTALALALFALALWTLRRQP